MQAPTPAGEVGLFIDLENIRYSFLNVYHIEPDVASFIEKARKHGRVSVALAYADFSEHPQWVRRALDVAGISARDIPVRRFVREELIPLEGEVEVAGKLDAVKARAIFEKSRALGLYAINIPTEYGGGGLSALDTCLAEEQFGHTTDILIRRAFGNVYEVLLLASPEQRARWLRQGLQTGDINSCDTFRSTTF